jgi:hypothetical protein
MNAWDEMRAAMDEAKTRMEVADRCATEMARMLRGRLRRVNSTHELRELKRELRDFDMTTGEWKK